MPSHCTHTIHGTGIFTDPWMVDFYGFHVGKYTSPMDGMGVEIWPKTVVLREGSPWHVLKFFVWKVLWWLEITTLRKYTALVRKASSLVSGPFLRCVRNREAKGTPDEAIYRNPAIICVAWMQAMFHLVQWNFKRTHVFNMQSFAPNSQVTWVVLEFHEFPLNALVEHCGTSWSTNNKNN